MVELVEYALVVMASTLFVAGSVLVYGNYSSMESGLSTRAAFAALSTLAAKAAEDGNATATMSLPSSVISCRGGVLSFSSGGSSQSGNLPVACGFEVSVSGGVHTLQFTRAPSGLELKVV